MLKKLSLAAVIAASGVSFASATPLTEAIKNVDLSGFLRLRFYNENPDKGKDTNRWRTNAVLIFKVPVSENINFVMRNSVESNVYTDGNRITDSKIGKTSSVDTEIKNNLLFMQYANGPLNAIVGKIPVATSITSADSASPAHGAGVIATYKVNDNLTVGAAWIDALEDSVGVVGNDVYAGVAVFNTNIVSGNAWIYRITNLSKYIATLSLDVKPIENIKLHADYAEGKDDVKNADTHRYFNASATYKNDMFSAEIGYAASNDKKGTIATSGDAPIDSVISTPNNNDLVNKVDTDSVYGKIAFKANAKASVYVAAQAQNAGKDSGNKNNDLTEYTVGAKYKYNKKLGFHVYYDIADWDSKADKKDNNEFRFEAKYSF